MTVYVGTLLQNYNCWDDLRTHSNLSKSNKCAFFQAVEELLYMQELDLSSKKNFAACREGNLLGHSLDKIS